MTGEERQSVERHGLSWGAFQAAADQWSAYVKHLNVDGPDGEPTGIRAEYRSALEAAIHAYVLALDTDADGAAG